MSTEGCVWSAVLLLLFLIALLPVGARVRYDGERFSFRLRLGRWDIGGEKKNAAPVTDEKKAPEKRERKKKKKRSAIDTVRAISGVAKKAAEKLPWLLRRVILQKLDIAVICGGEDAAGAAFGYGLACASLYPAAGSLAEATGARAKDVSVDIRCDYERAETSFTLDAAAALRVWALVTFAVWMLIAFVSKGDR